MKRVPKQVWIAAAAGVVALVAAVGGYAYFTSTGSGSGSATVGSAAGDIVVTGTASADVFPGGAGVPVTFTASNPAGFQQKLSTIHLASVDAAAGCDTSAFSMPDVTVGDDGTLAASATDVPLTETGTLTMADSASSQDACQGQSLILTFTTS